MRKLYTYDNYEGDKGIIVAVTIYREMYIDREIAETQEQYWDYGCYIEEIDFWTNEKKLYVVCEW